MEEWYLEYSNIYTSFFSPGYLYSSVLVRTEEHGPDRTDHGKYTTSVDF